MNSIRIEDGNISINDAVLPAVVTSISINNEVVWKEQTMLLKSGNEKTFNGFKDAVIDIALTIFEEHDGGTSRFEALGILENAFKAMEEETAAAYQIYGEVFTSAAIKEVFFSNLSVLSMNDSFEVNVSLKENNPKVAAVQEQQAASSSSETLPEAEWSAVSAEEERGIREMEEVVG